MSPAALCRIAALSVVLALASMPGCKCSNIAVHSIKCMTGDCCKTNQDCYNYEKAQGNKDPSNYFCDVSIETCFPITKVCQDQGQCCPGQICSATISECVDSYTACMTSADCTVAGQVCNPMLGSFPVGSGCTFNTCNPNNGNADCAAGLTCFNDYCVGQPPCNGGCPSGQVCTPVNNQCFQPDNPSTACQQTCAPGYELVFSDGLNVFNLCDPLEEVNCSCDALPPLPELDLARYSSAVVAGSNVLVSAYDGYYGDLVMHTFDTATLTDQGEVWIDGVPSTGTIDGDPNGPRGGQTALGPDVGRFTSIAYNPNAQQVHIAYYGVATDGAEDVNQSGPAGTPIQDLRYATNVADGGWTSFPVDGSDAPTQANGPVGMYTSITVSPDGAPVIAYFQIAGTGVNAGISAVKVARGKVPQPQSDNDFIISTIETEAVPPPALLADGGVAPAGPVDLPGGDGLFTGITYLNNLPVVVWYDHNNGLVKIVQAEQDSPSQGASFNTNDIVSLDTSGDDVGRYASIAAGPGSAAEALAVAYMDETTMELKVATLPQADSSQLNASNWTIAVADNGVGAATGDTLLYVGSNSSVQFLNGLLYIAYQDQTTGSLRLATQTAAGGSTYTVKVVDQDGAGGFYANLVTDGTNLYASHAVLQAVVDPNSSTVYSGNQLRVLNVQ